MAVKPTTYVITELGTLDITWANLTQTGLDTGTPVTPLNNYWKFSVQAMGTFGAAGAVVLEGSNDGVNYATLNDVAGAAISLTTTAFARLEAVPKFMRPRITAGDGTTNLTVAMHGVGS